MVMNDNEVIAKIEWTVADVRHAFADKYGRQPSDEELRECVDNVDVKSLRDLSTEYGWDFINDSII